LGNDLHAREGDGEGQSGENNEGDPGAEGPPPKAQTPSGFATNWPLHNRDSHGQSYCSGTSVPGTPVRAETAANSRSCAGALTTSIAQLIVSVHGR
jgi:hypothetical protein